MAHETIRAALGGLPAEPHGNGESPPDVLQRLLRAAREHLGMDVAFISEFVGTERVFRYVDAPSNAVRAGDAGPLAESYCQRVVDGRLPALIADATKIDEALALPATTALPVGAHVSLPLALSNGQVYGTFCCFSHEADDSLNERDLNVVRMFADVARQFVEAEVAERRRRSLVEDRIGLALSGRDCLTTVFQPVVALDDAAVLGVEALSRFSTSPYRTPDVWFADAASLGLGAELEQAALRCAVHALDDLPSATFLALNISPEAVVLGALDGPLDGVDLTRVVLEMTEHSAVADYDALEVALRPYRRRGASIAVDDAGAGYASFRHILRLRPEWIKMDASITRGIDGDSARLALASAMVAFADGIGSKVIAEGVETAAELRALESLGTTAAQGYHLGRPGPMSTVRGAASSEVDAVAEHVGRLARTGSST